MYLATVFVFLMLCLLLCTVILVQESKSSGLGASMGGSEESVFGTSTAEVLKRFTAYLGALFMLSCFLLSLWSAASS